MFEAVLRTPQERVFSLLKHVNKERRLKGARHELTP